MLLIYFAVVAFKKNALNIGVLFIELTVGFIGYSLSVISIRLITGRGDKQNNYLLSNTSLLIWGTIFGAAGVILIFQVIFNEETNLLISGLGSILMGLGAYWLVKIRKKN